MTYHLSTPESHREVHGNAVHTPPQEETLRRLRTLERLAQAVVDAAYQDVPHTYAGSSTLWGSVSYTCMCKLCGSTHRFVECSIADLERWLRGAP